MNNLAQSGLIDPYLVNAARAVPHQVSLVKLSKTQLMVLQSIVPGEEVTAEQIADRCELSSSWASTLLKRIWERGYSSRYFKPVLAGGGVFIYKRH